jgi:hypothetical protein
MPEWERQLITDGTRQRKRRSRMTMSEIRHRSIHGFMLNIIAGLIAYQLKDSKPSLNITSDEFSMMAVGKLFNYVLLCTKLEYEMNLFSY